MPIVERGWSESLPRKIKRGLARRFVSRPFVLPHQPIVSFTFDDIPESAARIGAPLLEKWGVRGTFYVAGGTMGQKDRYWTCAGLEDVRRISAAGHEIACHTADHVNVQSLGPGGLIEQSDRNAALIRDTTGRPVSRNFAYPFGDLGLAQKRVLERRFTSCRSIYERLNSGRIDLGCLGAVGLFDRTLDERSLERVLEDAVAQGAWLIFYTHDVGPDPTFMGTSFGLFERALSRIEAIGLKCLTIESALSAYGVPG